MDNPEQIREDMKLAQALRTPEGQVIIEHFEQQLYDMLWKLTIDEMTPEKRLDLATEIAMYGKLLKNCDGRVKNVLNLAARRMTRSHLHAAQP